MSQYREASGGTVYTWPYRMAISVNNASGSGGAPKDVTVVLPTDLDVLWTNIQTNGEDIRVTGSDGVTLLTFKLSAGFSKATRTGTIEIDDGVQSTAATKVLWLYWGNATVGAFTPWGGSASSPYSGYLVGAPGSPLAPDVRLTWAREPVSATKPSQRLQKTPDAQILIALEYRSRLATRTQPYAGGLEDEEPSTIEYAVYDNVAPYSAESGMVDRTQVRIDGDFVYVLVKSGTDDTSYTLSVVLVTTSKNTGAPARTLEMRAVVEVSDLIP